MKNLFCSAALLALPLLAAAQTKPATAPKPATKQVTEVTEDLDPKTGKVIRRTTRTTTLPADAPVSTAVPATTTAASDSPLPAISEAPASDTAVSDFLREKIVVSSLGTSALLDTYANFMDKVRSERRGWNRADWAVAASVMSSLNNRYEQIRSSFILDNKVTIRSQQVEFQTLRTASQISKDVSDKL